MSEHTGNTSPGPGDPDRDLIPDLVGGPKIPDAAAGRSTGSGEAAHERAGYGGYSSYGSGYGYPGQSYTGDRDRIHLVDYVRILHKRRWTALTVFVLVLGFMVVHTFTATPLYRGTVRILIENENPNVVNFDNLVERNMTLMDYYPTQYRILESRTVTRRVLDDLDLWDDPAFAAPSGEPALTLNPMNWAAHAYAFVKRHVSDPPPSLSPEEAARAEKDRIVDSARANVEISPVNDSRLVDVSYYSTSPEFAAAFANGLAKAYINENLESNLNAARDATVFLNERIAEQREALESSEQALQSYREQTGAISLEDRQNIVVDRLAYLNTAVAQARTERIAKEAVYNQIREVRDDPAALDTIPAVMASPFIQQLKTQLSELQRQKAQMEERLGARHPDMIKIGTELDTTERRLAAEVQKVVQALRNDYEAALANERSLNASLDQQRDEAQALNRMAIEYGVLERNSATNQVIFEGLLQRSKETDISGELKTTNVRIVDQAQVPQRPASPNKFGNLLIGLFGGTLLGIGLAFFFEYLDNRIKSPDEIKNDLGLSFLGLIPAVKSATPSPLVTQDVPAHFSEAFRGIRTNVLFSSADAGPRSVVVTSTTPGEGKTVVSSNLAMSLALAGQRVLLIDADMRRAKLHELFEMTQEPGLSNVLVGDGKTSEAVRRTAIPDLWVLPAGKHPPNPAELLGSKRFRDFLAALQQHFAWVVLDSPPVMAVTDASVLAHHVTGVVFVVGAEMTARGAAKTALEQLDGAKAKYIGGILNKVHIERDAYYYSRYYRRNYAYYYRSAANTPAP